MTFQPAPRQYLTALLHGRPQSVAVDSITNFRADSKYVVAYHSGGELLLDDTIKHLANEFAGQFLRIRRNTLIARHLVSDYQVDPDTRNGGAVLMVMPDGFHASFNVGRRFKETVLAELAELVAA